MTVTIHVVDYGIGNLYSVVRAIEKVGAQAHVTDNPEAIVNAGKVILPGVGAFRDGIGGLRDKGLDRAVMDFAKAGKPLLGICLGMQLLATRSYEFGVHDGLNLMAGDVVAIQHRDADGLPHKIPYVGWAELQAPPQTDFSGTVLADLEQGQSVYLVHSYQFVPANTTNILAVYDYDGIPVTAAVACGNIIGCQFHPEKSAAAGLAIIRRFAQI